MEQLQNELIFGKNPQERVVSVEAENGQLVLFVETKDGIEMKSIPNKFWILCNERVNKRWIRLKGNLHYKYGIQFDDRYEWSKYKAYLKKAQYDIYSIYDSKEASLVNSGVTYFKGMTPQEVSILSFDIETTGLKFNDDSKLLLISNTFRGNGQYVRKLFCYDDYENEGEMIVDWCKWVRECNPSIMCGHNIFGFDFSYINFIANNHGKTLDLGRDSSEIRFDKFESKFRKSGTEFLHYKKSHIWGREICDTYFLSLSYDIGKKYESYGLKQIIKQEGLEDEDRVFYDASQIRHKYMIPEEWSKIKKYAEKDADDSLKLFDLMIPAKFYFNQSIPKSFTGLICSATGSQLNSLMVRSYLQTAHSIPKADEVTEFPGAVSFAVPGIYRNVLKIDFAALYPSIIRQYEVYNREKDPKGNFLNMVEYFTLERLKNKKLAKETGKQYYSDLEQTQKIGINSSYGLLGCTGVNFNSVKHAAFITQKARELLEQTIIWSSGKDTSYWLKLFKEKCGEEVEDDEVA